MIIPVEEGSPNKTMGNCRICRKLIEDDENFHTCSNCHQYVCDDCSSYSSRDESKYWMCSFCRRRGSHLIPTTGAETLVLKRVPSFTRMQRYGSGDSTRGLSISKGATNMPPISPVTKRRPSLTDQPRQHSLETSLGHSSTYNNGSRRSHSRPCSPPDKYATDRYASSEALSDSRRSSNDSASAAVAHLPPSDSGFKSRDEFRVKSFSGSDSSNEDVNESMSRSSGNHKRQRSRKSKIHRQKHSLTTDDDLVVQSNNNINNNSGCNQLAANIEPHLRHISSDAVISYARNNGYQTRKSSESSDVSDMRYSPPPESLTPSSEYSRSPRESADSDMLGLPTYPHLQTQRRSIPSVLVDVVDTNHLTLKDCFMRRGSTGRALPKIPVEPSRSMLDLPHSRKSSSHSLDLPMDQPRRASAPEGENIRIVIDDVDSRNTRNPVTQFERVILHRDENDLSHRTRGFGLSVIGGKMNETDGNLYAYVAWIAPGGPADKMSLKPGDRILEWDGKSLINCSYEQVCHIIECSSDTAELIIESMIKSESNGHFVHQRRRLSQMLSQASMDIMGGPQGVGGGNASSRRRLPRTPESSLNPSTSENKQGEILLQCSLDSDHKQLTIAIICAKRVLGLKVASYAQLHILPELGFKVCKTEPSLTLEWNETLIFQQFPIDKVGEMALEISIWENCVSTGSQPKPLATTVIPLKSAILHHIDWWPLLSPNSNFIKATSMEYIAIKHEDLMNGSHSMPGSRRGSNRSSVCYESISQHPSKTSLASSGSRRSVDETNKKGFRQNTRHSVTDLNPIDPSIKELTLAPQYDPRTRRKSSSALAQAKLRRSMSLKSDNTTTNSRSDSVGSASDLLCDTDMNNYVKNCGEIKLGFIMTKGLLEIEVICARNLPVGINSQPPDTYVKVYLCDKGRQVHKRKTRVVQNECNPQYKQTLKYDASMIYGRSLLVSIWEKQKGFEHNLPIGATEIHVNKLELHKLTIKWYKLDNIDSVKQFSD